MHSKNLMASLKELVVFLGNDSFALYWDRPKYTSFQFYSNPKHRQYTYPHGKLSNTLIQSMTPDFEPSSLVTEEKDITIRLLGLLSWHIQWVEDLVRGSETYNIISWESNWFYF